MRSINTYDPKFMEKVFNKLNILDTVKSMKILKEKLEKTLLTRNQQQSEIIKSDSYLEQEVPKLHV